ncbi:hypothetical protein [Methylocystis sp. ATCC 49242]|uniref:hypothetical protein n=1 Tax=Methylocystis sp. ATCC 49242 TaxID=622637 RepID=UPI0001F87846|nr:hypothetical protein [Methylocystis sp. ATCC 49242]
MQRIPFVLSSLLFWSSAQAACVAPLGTFIGAVAGPTINRATKATVDQDTSSVSLTIKLNGAGTMTRIGKSVAAGNYVFSCSFTTVSFNPATCMATIKTNAGEVFEFTAPASATILTGIDITRGPIVRVGFVRLDKI